MFTCEPKIDFEKPNTLPSETVPGQSISIAELLKRHINGTLLDIGKNPLYGEDDNPHLDHDDPDMEKLRDSDLVEKAEFLTANAATKRQLDETVKKQSKALRDKKQSEFDEAVAKATARELAKAKSNAEPKVD